jgi:signal transduction histidine kinase
MTIRKRLIFSYIAMVVIPIFLFLGIATLLAGYFFDEAIGTSDTSHHGKPLPIGESFEKRNQLLAGVKMMAKYNPDQLKDRGYLEDMNKQFNQLHSGLVIVQDSKIIYASPLVKNDDLYEQLNQIEADQRNGWDKKINDRFTIERSNFLFDDQSSGALYLLSDLNPFFEKMWRFLPILLVSLLLVIGITNGVLTFFVSRSIIKPLYTLKRAAEQIKEGNLDESLNFRRKDEIGEVGEAFEEMRERLKRSIQLQLQYEENRKELVSNISHDLKTPITGIKACIEGIRDGIANTEEKRSRYIQMMDKKMTDMDHLIDELFLFSKLDLKRLPFHFENIDIVAYMRDCFQELKADPQLKEVSISLQDNIGEPQYVMGDREKLQRVIMNIINNSLKYMDGLDKHIKMKLTKGVQEITISIHDNGPGIDSEALPYIFDRFYRVDPSRNTLTGGSGLGLSIVKQIVEEHGGETWVDSEIGEGTTIFFTIPLHRDGESGDDQL